MSGNPAFDNPIYQTEESPVTGPVTSPDAAQTARPLPQVPGATKPGESAFTNPVYETGTGEETHADPHLYELDRISYTSDATIYASAHEGKSVFPRLLRNRKVVIGLAVTLLIVLVAVVAGVAMTMMSKSGALKPGSSPSTKAQTGGTVSERWFSGYLTVIEGRYSQYKAQFADKRSYEFISYVMDFKSMIEKIYLKTEGKAIFHTVLVQELRRGSVEVFFRLKYRGKTDLVRKFDLAKTQSTIMKGLIDEKSDGAFKVDLNSIALQEGIVEPPQPSTTTATPTSTGTIQNPATTPRPTAATTELATTRAAPLMCTRSVLFMKYCNSVVHYNSTTYKPYYGVQTESFLRRMFGHFASQQLSDRCSNHIAPFLCTVVFPQCQAGHRLPPCQEYCYAIFTGCWKSLHDVMNISQCLSYGSRMQKCVDTPNLGPRCSNDQFLCRNGPLVSSLSNCISKRRVCNGKEDCLDGLDERNCTRPVSCLSSQFACVNGSATGQPNVFCLPLSMRCNGKNECVSGSDELACDVTCGKDEVKCNAGVVVRTGSPCFPHKHVCDNVTDCSDGSDEFGCKVTGCDEDEFQCVTGVDKYNRSSCILSMYRCDRDKDCFDGSDEDKCEATRCPADQFQCVTGHASSSDPTHSTCVPRSGVCDGRFDCQDKSDENNCTTCTNSGFRCKDGVNFYIRDNQCIAEGDRCDGVRDCTDGSDEKNCPSKCSTGYRSCKSGYYSEPGITCYPRSFRCDRRSDCSDGSDEADCSYTCPDKQFRCASGALAKTPGRGFCLSAHMQCNGRPDCADGSDEESCHGVHCGPGQFYCGPASPRRCIAMLEVCDFHRDCGDGRDENGCQKCAEKEIKCKRGYIGDDPRQKCYTHSQRCDGTRQCSDGSDERECSGTASPSCSVYLGRFLCARGFYSWNGDRCVPRRLRCDRKNDCSDGSDERGCFYSCRSNQFKCLNSTLARLPYTGYCIAKSEECDGYMDCLDGSDEVDCAGKACADRHWKCTDGATDRHNGDHCIRASWLCDGEKDCTNGSDEEPATCHQHNSQQAGSTGK